MAITRLGQLTLGSAGASSTAAQSFTVPAGGIPAGSTIIVAGVLTSQTVVSLVDSKSNAWTTRYSGAAPDMFLADCQVTNALVSSDTITVTRSGADSSYGFVCFWQTACTYDRSSVGTFTGAAAAGPAITPAGNYESIYGFFGAFDTVQGAFISLASAGSGYTNETGVSLLYISSDALTLDWVSKAAGVVAAETPSGTLNFAPASYRRALSVAYIDPNPTPPPNNSVTQFLTGFEYGFVASTAAAGAGLIDFYTGTGFSASTTSPRNGSYCAHCVAPANTVTRIGKNVSPNIAKFVTRFAVKVSSRPSSASSHIFYANNQTPVLAMALSVSSAGVLTMQNVIAATSQAGATIDTTNWHLIEIQADAVAGTIDWKVDGVAQTRVTGAAMGTTFIQANLGTSLATQPAFTADYDDWIYGAWAAPATDWYGDGKVTVQLPGSDGTHATITSLSPGDAGTAYSGTPTTVNTMVDDPPGTLGWTATRSTTDNIALRTATVGAYAEIKPATTAESGLANAVRAIMSYSASATQTNLAACDVRNSEGTVTELWGLTGGVGQLYNIVANQFKAALVTKPAAGWTAAEVNAIRLRFGGCVSADISPVPTVQAMMLEVDWPVAAVVVPTVRRSKPTVMRQAVNRAAVI